MIFFLCIHVLYLQYIHNMLSPSRYNQMNERKKEKNVYSNEAHLLLLIVVIRTIIKIYNILFILLLFSRSVFHLNLCQYVVSIDK